MCHVGDEKGENSEVRWYSIANDKAIKSLEKGESYSI